MKHILLSLCMLFALQVVCHQVEAKIRTVEITIQEPEDDGGSPVEGYHVEMRSEKSTKWERITTDFAWPYVRRVFTYNYKASFAPGKYEFRAIAVTKYGEGEPSEPNYVCFKGEDDLIQGVVLICGDCPPMKRSQQKKPQPLSILDQFIPKDDVQIPYRRED